MIEYISFWVSKVLADMAVALFIIAAVVVWFIGCVLYYKAKRYMGRR